MVSGLAEDWLIPSGMLGATVSGLVSRSLYNAVDWHGCNSCTHLQDYDVSQSFVDSVDTLRQQLEPNSILASDGQANNSKPYSNKVKR